MSYLSGLQLLFIGLKLTNFIAWSWWLVMLPTLTPIGIFIVVAMMVIFGGGRPYISYKGKKRYF